MSGDIEDFLRRAAARRAGRSTPIVIDDEGQMSPERQEVVDLTEVETQGISSKFDQRTASFGAGIGAAADRREAALHEKFDHKLGNLEATGTELKETVAPVHADVNISEIAQLLRDPKSIRQAVILSEILRPPTERW